MAHSIIYKPLLAPKWLHDRYITSSTENEIQRYLSSYINTAIIRLYTSYI